MKLIKSITLIVFILFLTACKNEVKEEAPLEVKEVETKFEHKADNIEATFSDEKVAAVFNEYIKLKTALINTDAATAANAASDLMTAFANIGVDETVMTAAQKIVESSDIEAQRSAFVGVTNAVEPMLIGALDEGTIYKQYCPMAFKNTGAYWLSESKEIANPYFGDKMYRCGRVDKTIE